MTNKKSRIILDTNLWISFLLSKDFAKLDKLLLKGQVQLLFSEELLEEFISATKRPKLKKYFDPSDVDTLLETLLK
jgi:putative PIN family toxin of toxin-antitoxin system